MIIGVPKEIKNNECRVGLTRDSVGRLSLNHDIYIEKDAGKAIGFTDEMYESKGAKILDCPADVYSGSDLIVKVKEPLPQENRFYLQETYFFTLSASCGQ